ncbi:bifunctional 5,10-methylenetetrahydrofolate dehydrogenase/5,10-methenyltetrahydrofolate cyclohydrolase [Spiroplasma endosymbiont of Amphibalanus improvisus]|uniref:bifunctional 5,10-methylenetetrahydrofolate dehydrogenase/5,10-methenyltetrahydrofolate cyclohydrolase n=1 Tax=Spiroplasma endosymbiont of Amphibalanus improvisus TaxID=3066327 RepID=UPI00313DCE27
MNKKINCREIANSIKLKIKDEILEQKINPCLEIIQVGTDFASTKYINNKIKVGEELGVKIVLNKLSETITQRQLLKLIQEKNDNPEVNGILVQLPLPKHIEPKIIIEAIDYNKDVDGFHPHHLGKLFIDNPSIVPATCRGVTHILDAIELDLCGIDACVIGKSNIVGKPIVSYLLNKNASVSVCSKSTKNLSQYTKNADLIIIAAGAPDLVNYHMVKKNSIILDIGINEKNGKITGDLAISDKLINKIKLYTPVPGGIGLMTIVSLFENLLNLYKTQNKRK